MESGEWKVDFYIQPISTFYFLNMFRFQCVRLHTCFRVYIISTRLPIEQSKSSRAESDDQHGNPYEEPANEREECGKLKDDRAANESV